MCHDNNQLASHLGLKLMHQSLLMTLMEFCDLTGFLLLTFCWVKNSQVFFIENSDVSSGKFVLMNQANKKLQNAVANESNESRVSETSERSESSDDFDQRDSAKLRASFRQYF